MDDIRSLKPRSVEAVYKTDGQKSGTRRFTGVSFAELADLKKIDTGGFSSVSFSAADGYASAIPLDEALDRERCFIVIEEEGRPLGKKEDGGKGPYRMILVKDQFRRRWCSFLTEAAFK